MSPHVAATTPYPWPYDADLGGRATALLVVLAAGGSPAAPVAERLVGLAEAVRRARGAVLVVRTTAPAVGTDLDVAAALPAGVDPDAELRAGGIDGFYASDLDLVLRTRGVCRLLLAGVGLETCVHSTMRDANDRGYECLLVLDACVPVDPSLVPAAVSSIEMSGGIFGAVGRCTDVLAALADASGIPDLAPT